jgi:hypothetical protein
VPGPVDQIDTQRIERVVVLGGCGHVGLPLVAEIPTIWLERNLGISNFKVGMWIPKYLYWYRFAYGPRLTVDQVRARDQSWDGR